MGSSIAARSHCCCDERHAVSSSSGGEKTIGAGVAAADATERGRNRPLHPGLAWQCLKTSCMTLKPVWSLSCSVDLQQGSVY